MFVSIIIPTYNGISKVLNALKALEQQNFKDFEVIVVIDGSSDDTAVVLKNHIFNIARLHLIEQENRGRSGSRNAGARAALGDLLVFFDDDTRPLSDCVSKHLKHHQQKPHTLAVGNVPEDLAVMKTDFQHYKAYLSRLWVEPLKFNEGLIPADKPFLTAANFSIHKDLFWQLDGFDEKLTDAEDFDLGVRATQRGLLVYFLHDAIAWHDDFLTCRSYIGRQRQYKIANQKLRKLKPSLYEGQTQYVFNETKGLKRLVYTIFSHRFWIFLIDHTAIFKIFPKKLRYRLYSVIITALSVYFPNRSI